MNMQINSQSIGATMATMTVCSAQTINFVRDAEPTISIFGKINLPSLFLRPTKNKHFEKS